MQNNNTNDENYTKNTITTSNSNNTPTKDAKNKKYIIKGNYIIKLLKNYL